LSHNVTYAHAGYSQCCRPFSVSLPQEVKLPEGPELWTAWRAYDPRSEPAEIFEAALYSDADLVDPLMDPLRPVDLMPALPPVRHGLKFAAVARIRGGMPADVALSKSDTASYHGGGIVEEIASLISLALGVRCRSGGITRTWPRGLTDPYGTPIEFHHRRPYLAEQAEPRPLLPNLPQSGNLADCAALLDSFAAAEGRQATALVRAARLFEHALWVAEDDPNFSWLELVSSLEVVALESTADQPPAERLAIAKPELWATLLTAGKDHAVSVAEELADQVKSTARFRTFMERYHPDPPARRPSVGGQVDWTKMKKHLGLIYNYRSKALHSGVPFPQPMCAAPIAEPGGCAMEVPLGLSASAGSTVWMAKELPMHLHVFAYIARSALLNWWHSITATPGM